MPTHCHIKKCTLAFAIVATLLSGVAIPGAPLQAAAADHSMVPGIIIDHIPARSRKYIGSPAIAVLPDGRYLASHDIFGPGSSYSRTCVHRSVDKGETWDRVTVVEGQWWSTLFVYQGNAYLMGVSKRHGDAVIRRSTDGGQTWTVPTDGDSGLLLTGARYHCAPVPVKFHNGRIWRAMEDAMGQGGWGDHFRAFMMSAPLDADWLKAGNWTCSNRIARNPDWLDGSFGGWLEGNAVVTPDGDIVNILRVDVKPDGGKAAVIRVSADGKKAVFDPQEGFIDFPGGCKKFTIRFDPASKLYWSLTNYIPDSERNPNPGGTRNTLALVCSPDLKRWIVRSIVLHHPDREKHGFQYVDWLFEGRDIIAVSRTAYDDGLGGAHNYHDANYMTFHRIENFRTRVMEQ